MPSQDPTHPHTLTVTRTLRLKVRPESYVWLNAAGQGSESGLQLLQ
jgi:hypothetical protein